MPQTVACMLDPGTKGDSTQPDRLSRTTRLPGEIPVRALQETSRTYALQECGPWWDKSCRSIFIDAVNVQTRWFRSSRTTRMTSLRIAFRQPARSNLSRRAGCRLHGSLKAVELGAFVIGHEPLPVLDIEVVTGHGTLLLANPCSVSIFHRHSRLRVKVPWLRVLSGPSARAAAERKPSNPLIPSTIGTRVSVRALWHAPAPAPCRGQSKQSVL